MSYLNKGVLSRDTISALDTCMTSARYVEIYVPWSAVSKRTMNEHATNEHDFKCSARRVLFTVLKIVLATYCTIQVLSWWQ